MTNDDERAARSKLGVPTLADGSREHTVHVDDVRAFIEKVAANHKVILSESRVADLIYKYLWSASDGKAVSVNSASSDTHGINIKGLKRVIEEITLSEPESEIFNTPNDEVNTHTSYSVFTVNSLISQYEQSGVAFPASGDVLLQSVKSPLTSPIPTV